MSPPSNPWGPPRLDPKAMERALAASRAELALKQPVRRWRSQALGLFAASAGLALAVMGVLLALGRTTGAMLMGRAPLLAMLLSTSAVCAWGAIAPRRRGLRQVGVGMAMVAAMLLVLMRAAPREPSSLPEWVCTVSHLALALVPLVVALVGLRSAAFDPLRAAVAGLSVGTVGAFVGELACEQGPGHVATYHLGAWALVVLTTWALSKRIQPRTYAP
ncbi:NrsF family protein [Corallococcus sp. EGB]|uniref:NrsF family protein n=1 Tax=Corallococcus sp. EGB TaxID=1521117 RepID=UPI001CBEE482|nr:NrsF family protein [Corallococcus sp. EGB]